ncbi:MAG: hypothetical protein KBA81_06220 [Rhabdochlamydiaceae bacterium]|nr:hypothetical protein [Rhabdochlamydiaceae bacterium]
MNKPKYQITQRARKKMNKEVRASAIQPNPKPMSNTTKPASLLSRYPKKVQKKEKASLKSLDKNLSAKRKKLLSPHSKRTSPGSPGTEERQAAPKIVHIEGKRWIKSTESKIQANKKVMRRQTMKKKGR